MQLNYYVYKFILGESNNAKKELEGACQMIYVRVIS